MSHNAERKEKNCLNCQTQVQGRFCQVCGQENFETKESFWSLTKHFIYDIFHFDGKFFYTLKYLFTKPGFVARQYAEGKRASYLHPIRMYLFTSAVFFVVFFSSNPVKINRTYTSDTIDKTERAAFIKRYQKELEKKPGDSVLKSHIAMLLDTAQPINIDSLGWEKKNGEMSTFGGNMYSSVAHYDSLQAALPADKRDGWIKNSLTRQTIKTNKKYSNNPEGAAAFIEAFLHKLPYILFVSLPFFALILKLLYVRRKNFYYSDHAVFTLYHYILSFLLLLLLFGFKALHEKLGWGLISVFQVAIGLAWPVYLFIEMKAFYRQGAGKTFLKFILLNLVGFIFMIALFLLFLLISFFQS